MKKQANVILSIVLCLVLLAATTVPAFAALGTVKNLKVTAVTVNSAALGDAIAAALPAAAEVVSLRCGSLPFIVSDTGTVGSAAPVMRMA